MHYLCGYIRAVSRNPATSKMLFVTLVNEGKLLSIETRSSILNDVEIVDSPLCRYLK